MKRRDAKASLEMLAVMSGKMDIDDCKFLGKSPQKKVQHEAAEQEALIRWAKLQEKVYPQLEMLFAIPNGGSRHPLEAVNLKKQGVKAGVPDLLLSAPNKDYHGLYIEMKSQKGRVSDAQKAWIAKLQMQGYCVEVCYGWESAKDVILNYLSKPASKNKYGRGWKRIRDRYAKAHPLCELCLQEGRNTPVEEVHHIIPLSRGGDCQENNLMSLCHSCHTKVHFEKTNISTQEPF